MKKDKLQILAEQQQILMDNFKTLVLVDYCYECDSTPYYYKIVKIINENGETMSWPMTVQRYDKERDKLSIVSGNAYTTYKRSYKDYATFDEALEDGVKEAIELALICNVITQPFPTMYGNLVTDCLKEETKKYLNKVEYLNPFPINEEDSGYKKFMDYIRKKMDDTMRIPESAIYKHDETNSPLMKYCQPGMTVNLEKFLDNKEDK